MKNISSYIIISVCIIITSCTTTKKDGDWDDNIKLSTHSAYLNASSDSITINTEGCWWWITDVSVDSLSFFNFTNINQESDYYTIKQNCFNIERRGKNKLFVKINTNMLNKPRIITIGLEAGDYFDRITITQQGR